jgi:hypothetical protein
MPSVPRRTSALRPKRSHEHERSLRTVAMGAVRSGSKPEAASSATRTPALVTKRAQKTLVKPRPRNTWLPRNEGPRAGRTTKSGGGNRTTPPETRRRPSRRRTARTGAGKRSAALDGDRHPSAGAGRTPRSVRPPHSPGAMPRSSGARSLTTPEAPTGLRCSPAPPRETANAADTRYGQDDAGERPWAGHDDRVQPCVLHVDPTWLAPR